MTTSPKKKSAPDPTKPGEGFLVCDTCKRAVPYRGMPTDTPATTNWPKHKCVRYQVQPFDRWVQQDLLRRPLPARPSPLEQADTDDDYREVEI